MGPPRRAGETAAFVREVVPAYGRLQDWAAAAKRRQQRGKNSFVVCHLSYDLTVHC